MAQIRINSQDRVAGSLSSSNFTVYSSAHEFSGTYALARAVIPVSFYTVNNSNNSVYFTENSNEVVATIANGFYTDTTLAAAVATAMTTASSGTNTYTTTLSQTTEKMVVTASTTTFEFTFGTNTLNSANQVMGFSATDTALAASHTSDNIIDLAQSLCFNIVINDLNELCTTGNSSACTFAVPIDQNSQGIVIYTPHRQQQTIHFWQPTKCLQVRLTDDQSRTLDLNGLDWMLILSQKC